MKKNNKKTTQNDPVIVFIGKSNTIKSLKMAKQVAAYVDSKYNSHVNIYSRVKKPTPFIEAVSFCLLLFSCIIFLVLMFSKPVLDFIGYSSVQDIISDHIIPLYLIGLFSFLISRVIIITGTFEVFVNGRIVYKKKRMDRMESFENIVASLDYYMKQNINDYEYYLKKKSD